MNIHLDCPGCGRLLRVNEQFAGRTVRCPSCGTAYTAPAPRAAGPARGAGGADDLYIPCERCGLLVPARADGGPVRCAGCRDAPAEAFRPADSGPSEAVFAPPDALTPVHVATAEPPPLAPAESPPAAAGGPPCPECGAPMAADAVVCIACGFNRATGRRLKTVSRRFARRWDSGNLPLAARAVLFLVVFAACFVPLLVGPDDPLRLAELLLIPVAGAALGGLTLGTLRRLTVTTDPQGTPVVLEKWWICFFPISENAIRLYDFRTVRLTYREGDLGALGLLAAVGLCLLGGLPAILWRMHLLRQGVYTVDIVSRPDADGQPLMEPLTLYHGRSERMARAIGDALEQIAGLRYG